MKDTTMDTSAVLGANPKLDHQMGIENHKKAATHFEAAAKSHLEAATHHENKNHEKAAECTVKAHGHSCLANDAQKEVVKFHATKD